MLKELNQQRNEELYSSCIYLAMASDLEIKGFKGMATWMRVQAREVNDNASVKMLLWFVEEQVEEEVNTSEAV